MLFENFKCYSVLIDKILVFMVEVVDIIELMFDLVMDIYYFMDMVVFKMLVMFELLGIIWVCGIGVLVKKELVLEVCIEIVFLFVQIGGILCVQNNNLEKVVCFCLDLQGSLSGLVKQFMDGVDKMLSLICDDIFGEKFVMLLQEYFVLIIEVIDIGYKMMFEMLILQFEQ